MTSIERTLAASLVTKCEPNFWMKLQAIFIRVSGYFFK